MTEQFINACIAELGEKIDRDTLEIVYRAVSVVAANYDICQKQTAIVPYSGYYPSFYKDYFVVKKIEGMSDKTLKLYHLYLSAFFEALQCDIEKITPNMVRAYLYKIQQERSISNRTLDSRRSVLSSFFSWASSEGYIKSNPCASIKPIKYSSKPRVKLSGIELEKVRSACRTTRSKAMIEMFYSTGCRVSELVGLNREDVDFDKKEVILYGKGGKYRISYITPRAEVALQEYLNSRTDKSEALFVSERKPYDRIQTACVRKVLDKLGEDAGLDRKLFPHLLRGTMASDALNKGMDVTEIQKILGHSNINTTMTYAKISNEKIKHDHQRTIA